MKIFIALALCLALTQASVDLTITGDNRYDMWVNGVYIGGAKDYGSDPEEPVNPLNGCEAQQTGNGCENSSSGSGLVDLTNWGKWRLTDTVTFDLPTPATEFVVALRGLQGYPDDSRDKPTTAHPGTPVGIIAYMLAADGREYVTNEGWWCTHDISGVETEWLTVGFNPIANGWQAAEVQANYGGGDWGTGVSNGGIFASKNAKWIWTAGGNAHNVAYCRLHVPGDDVITTCDPDVDCGCKDNVVVSSTTKSVTLTFDSTAQDTCSDSFPKDVDC